VLFFSPPFCTGYALQACRFAGPKYAAWAGLVLAGLELLFLIALMIIGLAAA
jgi:hypothetical protein